jgi:hypothetical protein
MVAEASGILLPVKQIGRWKSSKVAEGYIAESIRSKMEVGNMILSIGPSNFHLKSNEVSAATSLRKETVITRISRNVCKAAGIQRQFQRHS